MYLNKTWKKDWRQFLLVEAVENLGLPPVFVNFLRSLNNSWGPVSNKQLTWIGALVKTHNFEVPAQLLKNLMLTIPVDITDPRAAQISHDELRDILKETYQLELTIMDIKSLFKQMNRKFKANGFMSYDIDIVEQNINDFYLDLFNEKITFNIQNIIKAIKSDPDSFDKTFYGIRDLVEASAVAKEVVARGPILSQKQIIHKFPNGLFWYDLETNRCDIEGAKMRNCGEGAAGTLYSLRSMRADGISFDSHITIEYGLPRRDYIKEAKHGTIYQVKGAANTVPKKHYWAYINWFAKHFEVDEIVERGQYMEGDFKPLMTYLQSENQNINIPILNSIEEALSRLAEKTTNEIQVSEILSFTFKADGDPENGFYTILTHAISADVPIDPQLLDKEDNVLLIISNFVKEYIKIDAQRYVDLQPVDLHCWANASSLPPENMSRQSLEIKNDVKMLQAELVWKYDFPSTGFNHLEEARAVSKFMIQYSEAVNGSSERGTGLENKKFINQVKAILNTASTIKLNDSQSQMKRIKENNLSNLWKKIIK
jgi:hypothetical protein